MFIFLDDKSDKYQEILQLIEGKPLRNFLKKYGLTGGTSKADRRQKIIGSLKPDDQVESGGIPYSAFTEWIKRWYIPGNKNVFIFELDERTIGRLKSKNEVDRIIEVNQIMEKMGSLEDTDKPLEPTLIMFNVRSDDDVVNSLEFGFVQMGQLRDLDEENDVITWTPINFYVYAEIDLQYKQLSIWIEPTKKLHKLGDSKKGSFQDVAEEYKRLISAIFGLTFQENDWISKALYLMWEEDTMLNDEQIQNKLDLCKSDLNEFVRKYLPILGINKFTEEEVCGKFSSLIEGLLIRQYGIQQPEKPGWVKKHRIFDGTAVVETSNDMPIYNSTSHYGLQAIVNEVGEINKLEYTWTPTEDDEDTNFSTTIQYFQGFFGITFWGFREEDEIRHVLSGINGYKQRVLTPPRVVSEV